MNLFESICALLDPNDVWTDVLDLYASSWQVECVSPRVYQGGHRKAATYCSWFAQPVEFDADKPTVPAYMGAPLSVKHFTAISRFRLSNLAQAVGGNGPDIAIPQWSTRTGNVGCVGFRLRMRNMWFLNVISCME